MKGCAYISHARYAQTFGNASCLNTFSNLVCNARAFRKVRSSAQSLLISRSPVLAGRGELLELDNGADFIPGPQGGVLSRVDGGKGEERFCAGST